MKPIPAAAFQSIFVILDLKGSAVDEILLNIALFAKRQGLVQDEKILYGRFREREKQGTTAIGNGVALPEACWIEMSCSYAFILCRTKNPVTFNSLDGKPVRIILASLGRDKNDFSRYKPMVKLIRLLKSQRLRTQFLKVNSITRVKTLLK